MPPLHYRNLAPIVNKYFNLSQLNMCNIFKRFQKISMLYVYVRIRLQKENRREIFAAWLKGLVRDSNRRGNGGKTSLKFYIQKKCIHNKQNFKIINPIRFILTTNPLRHKICIETRL